MGYLWNMKNNRVLLFLLVLTGLFYEMFCFAYVPFVDIVISNMGNSSAKTWTRVLCTGGIIVVGIILTSFIRNFINIIGQKTLTIQKKNKWINLIKIKKCEELIEYGESKFLYGLGKNEVYFKLLNAESNIVVSCFMIMLFSLYITLFIKTVFLIFLFLLIVIMLVFSLASSPLDKKGIW